MIPITELLLGATIRTAKSGVMLQNIDRVEFDHWGRLRIRGYAYPLGFERWTILDPHEIDLTA